MKIDFLSALVLENNQKMIVLKVDIAGNPNIQKICVSNTTTLEELKRKIKTSETFDSFWTFKNGERECLEIKDLKNTILWKVQLFLSSQPVEQCRFLLNLLLER